MSSTHKAARLGTDWVLSVEDTAAPQLRPGGVIISVLASLLPPFTADVLSGKLRYPLPELPVIPGVCAVGEVDSIADDVFDIEPGQLVLLDPQVFSSFFWLSPGFLLAAKVIPTWPVLMLRRSQCRLEATATMAYLIIFSLAGQALALATRGVSCHFRYCSMPRRTD